MNDAAINIGVHFFSLFSGSGIARSYGRSIFNFLWNLHTVSVVAASIYIPINSARGFPLITSSPILFFLITAILIGVRCYLTVVLICISLMICDVYVLSCNRLFCDPMDCSPPGSSVHEIFQVRILEWVPIS